MTPAEYYQKALAIMPLEGWVAVASALAFLVAVLALVVRARRRRELIARFGDEYSLAVDELGSERAAIRELRAREARVKKLHVHALNDRQRRNVTGQWLKIQATFVENPFSAVRGANMLIKTVMQQQGYPASEPFEQRLNDLAVDHAHVVRHYREARALTERSADTPASTEELRQAMLHYGKVIDELTQPTAAAAAAWRSLRTT
jgi:hypothetical protein